jgi:hypothetical protein
MPSLQKRRGRRAAEKEAGGAKGEVPQSGGGDSVGALAAKHWAPDVPNREQPSDEVIQGIHSYLSVPTRESRERSGLQGQMSITVTVTLKFREGVPAGNCFHADNERSTAFFGRVFDLPTARPQTRVAERTRWLLFLVHESPPIDTQRLVSLPMRSTISPVSQQPAEQSQLARPWKTLTKRRAKGAKLPEGAPASSRHEREFIPSLPQENRRTRAAVDAAVSAGDTLEEPADGAAAGEGGAPAASAGSVRCLERLLEFFTDLLAQLPTRRFFHTLLLDSHVLVHASLSAFAACAERAALFNLLLKLLVLQRAPNSHSPAPARPAC